MDIIDQELADIKKREAELNVIKDLRAKLLALAKKEGFKTAEELVVAAKIIVAAEPATKEKSPVTPKAETKTGEPKAKGKRGRPAKKTRVSLTDEEKKAKIEKVEELKKAGKKGAAVFKEADVTPVNYYNWKKKFK